MAEAAAAFYTVESVVEGAAVGAYAVAQPTTPLHVRFRNLKIPFPPGDQKTSLGHSLDVVKGQAYIFGGDNVDGKSDRSMRVVKLPSGIETGETDCQIVEPTFDSDRPLQPYSASQSQAHDADSAQTLLARAAHASTSIGSNVYIVAGRSPQSLAKDQITGDVEKSKLYPCDQILSFSTQTNKWTVIDADAGKSKHGVPPPRAGASCTSTPHPQPESAVDATVESHGTIFLHGGYDAQGQLLRDTWAFDLSSGAWTRWPDLPGPLAEEVAGEGRVTCVGDRLWRAGDGFGKMMYIDFDVIQGDFVGKTSGPKPGEVGILPQTSSWEILSFGEKAANTALMGEIGAGSEKPLVDKTEQLPVPRKGAGLVPIKVGAGRTYLLYFMGQDGPNSVTGDVWSFQVQSESKTPAAVKDKIRTAVGKESGENKWATCDIVQSTKEDGPLLLPQGLNGFVADSWKDLGGGNVLLYGGVGSSDIPAHENCWIMSAE